MKNICAIVSKQIKDTLKNKAILIQFVMLPLIGAIFESTIKLENMPDNFFSEMFAAMHIGMAPLVAVSSIVAEEREKNTLRVLMMADVTPLQYMTGVGGYVWVLCMLGSAALGLSSKYSPEGLAGFLLVAAVGHLISIFIGAAVGMFSATQMTATSVGLPVAMVFAFLPMMAMFNSTIEKIARFTYTQQIKLFLARPEGDIIGTEGIIVLAVSMLAALSAFIFAYKRNGLE